MKSNYQRTLVVFLVAAVASCVAAQENQTTDVERKQLMKKYYRIFASRAKFSLDKKRPLEFVDKPVLSWTGMESGDFSSGDVFVWERAGRAEVIACIGSIPSPVVSGGRDIFQEYHSLAIGPIEERPMGKQKTWAPKLGVELMSLNTDLSPAKSATLRLAQMRRLASQFRGYMKYPGSDKEDQLRVMSQPIYRYNTKKLRGKPVVDGAIFAFVWGDVGTDPELLLLLECHAVEGNLQWQYSPVRFTWRELRMEYMGQQIWHVGRRDRSPTSPFFLDNVAHWSFDQVRSEVEKASK